MTIYELDECDQIKIIYHATDSNTRCNSILIIHVRISGSIIVLRVLPNILETICRLVSAVLNLDSENDSCFFFFFSFFITSTFKISLCACEIPAWPWAWFRLPMLFNNSILLTDYDHDNDERQLIALDPRLTVIRQWSRCTCYYWSRCCYWTSRPPTPPTLTTPM